MNNTLSVILKSSLGPAKESATRSGQTRRCAHRFWSTEPVCPHKGPARGEYVSVVHRRCTRWPRAVRVKTQATSRGEHPQVMRVTTDFPPGDGRRVMHFHTHARSVPLGAVSPGKKPPSRCSSHFFHCSAEPVVSGQAEGELAHTRIEERSAS